ncbi:hypothetical protein [Anaerofustis stercorihominis]|uniref:Uncharacterized protein n=1 Tax=Anaerofustis stercorihominis TaxID=214853 RepID=A0A3E3DWH7_9FIRM|nr:hypothetical protein [Anaerofustis stercorihominis]RGD73610.1 hypothetical protein DW687_09675 [Anaerofustis stercorihominis]
MKSKLDIIQNLKDAGCNDDFITKYIKFEKYGNHQGQLRFLSMHRTSLINQIHDSYKMIDCLDYLIYKMKKQIY